ncbi:MAG TPA: glycosyltransferase [Blastocatellia bacterium]|nr:glycosyltransferase [Blastocatellia bacterium]
MDPKVSFVVPCYKLAHFLGDCVNSILTQTYGDFEIIIMDDCSPDNTPQVAAGFKDPRVIYVRNEPNLGNIRNFNKGIEMARGRYIWLLSADDCLRSRNVLQRYVELLDNNPGVGFVFCPVMSLQDGKEAGVDDWTAWPGDQDQIISGREIVRRSAYYCAVPAASGLVRRECYARKGLFRTDLPRASDYYLWAMFGSIYDAGYFAEPMVYYRQHSTNMDKVAAQEQPASLFDERLRALWTVKKEIEGAGIQGVSTDFHRGLTREYTWRLVDMEIENAPYGRTWDAATKEIRENASSEKEAEEILQLIRNGWKNALAIGHAWKGADYYQKGQFDKAVAAFRSSLSLNPRALKPRAYIYASRLERLFGVRLIPLLKSLRKSTSDYKYGQ